MKRLILCAGAEAKTIRRALEVMNALEHSRNMGGLILIDDTPPAPVLELKKLPQELLDQNLPLIDLPRDRKDWKTIKERRAEMRSLPRHYKKK